MVCVSALPAKLTDLVRAFAPRPTCRQLPRGCRQFAAAALPSPHRLNLLSRCGVAPFTARGEFEFACLILGHRESGMVGNVTVK